MPELLQNYREVSGEVLRLLNDFDTVPKTLGRLTTTLRTHLKFDAVGIRLQEGEDFPYFVQEGFSARFLETENSLLSPCPDGGICRNPDGSPCLECTCGLLLAGRADPSHPCVTPGGSFWTNNSFALLDFPRSEDPRLPPRNRCLREGYASVALVPIRSRARIIGLLQLNDRRHDRFTLEAVEILEGIAAHIGAAMLRKFAEEDLQRAHDSLERRVAERTEALRRANDALQASEARFHGLFNSLTQGFVLAEIICDAEGRPIDWRTLESNPAFEKLTGVPTSERLAKTALELAPQTERFWIEEYGKVALTGQPATFERYGTISRKFWRIAAFCPAPGTFAAVYDDITDRKAMEAALHRSEEQYRSLIQHMRVGVVVYGPDGAVQLCNPEAARLLGSAAGPSPGSEAATPTWRLVRDDGSPLPAPEYPVPHTLATRRPWEDRLLRIDRGKPDDLVWVVCSAFPEIDELQQLRHVVMTLTDMTERKRAEADRLIVSKLESTGILAGGLAHDFNNLLTSILLGVGLAEAQSGTSGGSFPGLQEAKLATLAAQSLTKQLITFADGGEPVRRRTDFSLLLPTAVRVALAGSAVRSHLTLPPDLWMAEVDDGQISQVIRNVVHNARDASRAQEVVEIQAANVTVASGELPGLSAGDYVRISVTDHGDGMAPEVLARIFDPYFSTKPRGEQKGMGLGLTICHSVIQKHHGTITVTSTPGRGTTVGVYVPAVRAPVETSPVVPVDFSSGPSSGRILVMDDEPLIRKSLQQALGRLGYRVVVTANGREAIEAFAQARQAGDPIDLAILDLTVRDGPGGLEAMQGLRSQDPNIRAVLMSGYSRTEVLQNYARYGFVEALPKPFELGTLRAVISRALARK